LALFAAFWLQPLKETLKKLHERLEAQKQLETEIDALKFQIQKYAGDNEIVTNESGQYLVLLKTQERTGIDSQRFKKEQPDLFAQYAKTTHSRPFKLVRSA
jgi:predicted phage-related endonuclease